MPCTKYVTPDAMGATINKLNESAIPYNLQDPISSDVLVCGYVLKVLVSNHLAMHGLKKTCLNLIKLSKQGPGTCHVPSM